ncbi:hypothetical protein BVRB_7g178760 [Beta vulgaris subsp. vulgaris]|uniref:Uncharacterized protein n=1 Tax=Beta vulgaris subsp. vulgaris TaxID=3555 RepID=A0A0J8B780_BETVV|nr:hypothetical protein BVRB_7g178760 [Beta vulgaris subsp. vulgaris]
MDSQPISEAESKHGRHCSIGVAAVVETFCDKPNSLLYCGSNISCYWHLTLSLQAHCHQNLFWSIIEDSGAHDDILDHENYMLLYTVGGITRFA